jgi:glycosyl transferase family 25
MITQFGIEGIYIVHAKNGYEYHENRINKIFKQYGLNYEFMTDGDPSCFSIELLEKYFIPDIRSIIPDGTLSCTLNHILSYEQIVKNQNKFALVFENDPVFLGDFLKKIANIANEANRLEEGFIISLENTTLKFPPYRKIRKGQLIYEASYGRCAGAYMIDLKGAKDILKYLKTNKCKQIIDWWHNTLIDNHVIKMYWAHPPFVEQGSHNGLMSSSISTKNKSFTRRVRWIAHKYYKMYITRWFK